jgi:hypothetical protein
MEKRFILSLRDCERGKTILAWGVQGRKGGVGGGK